MAVMGAAQVRAAWLRATGNHFVIDADTDEARLRDFAEKLSRYDLALSLLYAIPNEPGRRSNPVHIYATRPAAVPSGGGVLAFYTVLSDPIIVTTELADRIEGGRGMTAEAVLLHEYAHHVMLSSEQGTYPLWYREGFAELNSHARFDQDGSITIGLAANDRSSMLLHRDWLPVSIVLDPPLPVLRNVESFSRFYASAWLLTHYLTLNDRRKAQLPDYLRRVSSGQKSLPAGIAAFGDLRALDQEVHQYLRDRRLTAFRLPPPASVEKVTVRSLSTGEAEMMPIHLTSTLGVNAARAPAVLRQARAVAARFPDDPAVQAQLAEAAYDAHRDDLAGEAADRALARQPDFVPALIYKGKVEVRRAIEAKVTDGARWQSIRRWYVRANRIDPNAARPLKLYYQSFLAAGQAPSEAAVAGLERSVTVNSQDAAARLLLARQRLTIGETSAARMLLLPLAFGAHGRDNTAQQAIDFIDAGKPGEAIKLMEASSIDVQ